MMDMQAAPPTYTPAGGLPAQGGLSVLANPMAQQLQSYGRGDDSMLVHMTPGEVNSLQGLAMAAGGSLTINPETGLPEAGWLGNLLPMIIGAIATPLTGGLINPLTASAIMGVGTAAVTGDLTKGLMAGLQTYGGAAMGAAAGLGAGSFGIGAAGAGAAGTGAGTLANLSPAMQGAISTPLTTAAAPALAQVPTGLAGGALSAVPAAAPAAGLAAPAASAGSAVAKMGLSPAMQAASAPIPMAAPSALGQVATGMPGSSPGFFTRFGEAAKAGLPSGTPGIIAKNAPIIAGAGILSGLSDAMQPSMDAPKEEKSTYAGPYSYTPRDVSYPSVSPDISRDSSEHKYFSRAQLLDAAGNPAFGTGTPAGGLGTLNGMESILSKLKKPPKYAGGGKVNMARGSFVMDARSVSEYGNGSSGKGLEFFAKMGGQPLQGPGDGVSDSIPARIGRDQPARVARDEVLFSPEAVRRIGKGSAKRGAQKLYALMDKAHKARKKAKRGQDTGLRKGLA